MSRCITLLTDFGMKDASVSIAKSILMQYNPDTPVLDISHSLSGTILTEAAYLLAAAYPVFPEGSCHVVYTGIYYSKFPLLILCRKNGHYFLAPDNGIMGLTLGEENLEVWKCFELTDEFRFQDWQHRCARICRDLAGQTPEQLGLEPHTLNPDTRRNWPAPVIADNKADCQILHITPNGNVVINMKREHFETLREQRNFRIELAGIGRITTISKHAGKVGDGEVLCRFNTAGYLEIAINGGPAAELLGFSTFSDNKKFYSSVKIFFE